MSPQDQRKRLQVVTSLNPSLRSAAAPGFAGIQGGNVNSQGGGYSPQSNYNPQQSINNLNTWNPVLTGGVGVSQPGNLNVGNRVIRPNSQTVAGKKAAGPGYNWASNPGTDLVNNLLTDAVKPIVGLGAGLGYQGALGIGNSRFGKAIGYHAPLSPDSVDGFAGNLLTGSDVNGTWRNVGGNAAQVGIMAGTGLVGKGVGLVAGKTIGRFAGPLATKLVGDAVTGGLVGGPYNVAGLVTGNGDLNAKNVAKAYGVGTGVGAAGGLGFGVLGAGANRAMNGSATQQLNRMGVNNQTVDFLKKSNNADDIHNVLVNIYGGSSDAIKHAAGAISKSGNSKFILHTLQDLPVEAGAATTLAAAAGDSVTKDEMAQLENQARQKDAQQRSGGGPTMGGNDSPTSHFTPEEQKFLDDNNIDTSTPSYQTGRPTTVGEAVTQNKLMGKTNVPDEAFSADYRTNHTAEPGYDPNVEIPSYIKSDPDRVIGEANTNLRRIDETIARIGKTGDGGAATKFNAKQALADGLRANPQNREALLAKYEHDVNAYDPQASQEQVNKLLAERQQYQRDLNLAQQAKNLPPEAAPPVEATPVAQEAAAQNAAQATPETAPQGTAPEASASSVENSATGIADATNANADANLPPPEVEKVPTMVKHFGNKETVVRKIGTPSAQKLADEMHLTENEAQQLRAEYKNNVNLAYNLSKDELNNLGRVVEHGDAPINGKVAAAAAQWDANSGLPYNDFVSVGGKTGFIENHFPRHYNPDTFKPGTAPYQQAIDHLVKSGQAATPADATRILSRFKGADSVKPGFFGNFDKSRLDLGDGNYTYTHDALEKYHNGAAVRNAQANHFGASGEQAADMLANIQKEGGDAGLARKALSNYIAPPDTTGSALGKAGGVVRGIFSTARLGKAVISHAGQTSNVSLVARTKDLATGWARFLSRNAEDRAFVKETDVNNPFNLHGIQDQTTGVGGVMSKATAPLLTQMMHINRSVTALAARDYGRYLASKGDEAALRNLGVTGDIGTTLNRTQEGQIARGLVNKTMFNPSRLSTPVGAETTGGKFVGQYRLAYGYKQTGLLWDSVIKEAGKGNLKPLTKFLAISVPTGVGTQVAKNQISGSDSWKKEGIGGKIMDTAAMVGGLPAEIAIQGARYGGKDLVKTVAGTVAPVAGEAVDIAERAQKALKGNFRPVERYAAGLIPVGGTRVANKVAPNPTRSNITDKKLKNGDTEVAIKDTSGNPVLDKSGKPTTIIVPQGVTGPVKDILVANAQAKAVDTEIKNSLNANDRALFDLGNKQLEKAHNEGKIDDSTYDRIHAYYQVADGIKSGLAPKNKSLGRQSDVAIQKAYDDGKINDATYKEVMDYKKSLHSINGKGDYAPEGITNTDAQNFYKKYNGKLTAYDQKKFLDLKTKPEQEAINLAESINKNLPPGLSKFKPSNRFALDYAKYEADIQSHPEYNEVDKVNKLKAFLYRASVNQYGHDTQSVFKEGSSGDLKKLLKLGKMTKAGLTEAIALDDNLLGAGVTATPKFSNKFREANGFGKAPKPGAIGGGSGGGGGGGRGRSGRVTQSNMNSIGKASFQKENGKTSTTGINASGFAANSPIGLTQLMPKNLSFKQPTISTTPEKKSFKINLPSDVTGKPRPSRVVSVRAKRARIL